MNKSELIDAIAARTDLSKVAAAKAVNAYHEVVKAAIKDGNSVGVVGFGTFSAADRKARTGRNPKTGAALKIKAAKVPKFRAGKALRDSLN
jgi:DNA-binding protein HU-beta